MFSYKMKRRIIRVALLVGPWRDRVFQAKNSKALIPKNDMKGAAVPIAEGQKRCRKG